MLRASRHPSNMNDDYSIQFKFDDVAAPPANGATYDNIVETTITKVRSILASRHRLATLLANLKQGQATVVVPSVLKEYRIDIQILATFMSNSINSLERLFVQEVYGSEDEGKDE